MTNNKFGYIIGYSGWYITQIYNDYLLDDRENDTSKSASEAKLFDFRDDAQTVANCLTLKNGDKKFTVFRYECLEKIEEIL